MRQQATPVEWPGIHGHQWRKGERRRAALAAMAEAREGMIYTAAGVLDMTRQRKQRQPAVEEIVIHRIGGAKAW